MCKQPLVSVVVVTYNSSKTIIESLESVRIQTYKNLELIISDDCSKDDTVAVCKKWILQHSNEFASVQLLTAERNQGVCGNANKGRFAAKGEWQMGLAGDDILLPNCISDNMEYVHAHPETSFVFSYMKIYNDEFKEENIINKKKGPRDPTLFNESVDIQLRYMAYCAYVYATTMFVKGSAFKEVGGFNNKYGYEDWPFFIDILEKGYKIDLLDRVTYGYRIHESQSHSAGKLFNYSLTKKTIPFVKERCFKYYNKIMKIAVSSQWLMERILYKIHLDRSTPFVSFLYKKATTALYLMGYASLERIRNHRSEH